MSDQIFSRRSLVQAVLGGALLSGCGFRSYGFRYRFKVVVRAGDALREGASVIHARFSDQRGGCCGSNFPTSITGESPAVEIRDGDYLFALLVRLEREPGSEFYGHNDSYAARMPVDVLSTRLEEGERITTEGLDGFPMRLEFVHRVRDEVNLLPEHYPTFVRFENLNDPASVALVDANDLAASFGPGVSLERCSVQQVDEPVSHSLIQVLPWLEEWPGRLGHRQLDGSGGMGFDPSNAAKMLTDEYLLRRGV